MKIWEEQSVQTAKGFQWKCPGRKMAIGSSSHGYNLVVIDKPVTIVKPILWFLNAKYFLDGLALIPASSDWSSQFRHNGGELWFRGGDFAARLLQQVPGERGAAEQYPWQGGASP